MRVTHFTHTRLCVSPFISNSWKLVCLSIYLRLLEACVSVHLSQTHESLCVSPFISNSWKLVCLSIYLKLMEACQSIYLKLVEACVSVHLSQTHGSLCVCPFISNSWKLVCLSIYLKLMEACIYLGSWSPRTMKHSAQQNSTYHISSIIRQSFFPSKTIPKI